MGLAANRRFAYPRHLQLIDQEIVEAIARGRAREEARLRGEDVDDRPEILLIEVPPRHGKSTEISEHTPAWYLGRYPNGRVILASYGADFASSWGFKARELLETHGPSLFGVTVDPRSKAADRWRVAGHGGGMITAGVGGRITGEGADLLIIDDPVKNAEESMSEVIREKHWDWWLSTARTRLEPGAVVIVLMTRWHEADLGGKLLEAARHGGDPVREIRLPAIAGKDDVLGRAPGEALWPERYSAAYLEHTRKVLGAYWFSAMYQGSPTPDEGGMFSREYFHYFTMEGDLAVLRRPDGSRKEWHKDWCTKVTYADLAISEKTTADYTVATEVWITPDKDMLVRSVTRERIPGPAQPAFFKNHYVGRLKVEEIGYQSSLIQTLRREGLPVEAVYPDKDKVTRASAAGANYRAGKVYHLAGAEWLHDFEHELLAFPAGEHDDMVDTIAYAAKDLPDIRVGARKQKSKGKTVTGGLKSKAM